MAKWVVYRRANGVMVLVYHNVFTGASEKLGEMRRDLPEDLVVDWIVMQGNPAPGDIVSLASGRVAVMSKTVGIA